MAEPSFKLFPESLKCPRCKEQMILDYHRMLDPYWEGQSENVKLPSNRTLLIFGRKALSNYGGNVLYLGRYNGEQGSFDMLCCGNCWLYHCNSQHIQDEIARMLSEI